MNNMWFASYLSDQPELTLLLRNKKLATTILHKYEIVFVDRSSIQQDGNLKKAARTAVSVSNNGS